MGPSQDSSDLISRPKIHKRLDLGFLGWANSSGPFRVWECSVLWFFWLRFCSSSPRQVCKILCRTEPGADLGHVYFVQSCTRSAHALKSWDIVALSLCLRSSCFSVELSSTTRSLLLLQLYVHASSIIDTNSGKC